MSKRVPVSIQKPDRDFETFFTIPIAIKKLLRKNRGSVFIWKSDPGFSGKTDPRFSCENRIAIEKPRM